MNQLPHEPINWHLRTTKHDRCPQCTVTGARGHIVRRVPRSRACTVCGTVFRLSIAPKRWVAFAKVRSAKAQAAYTAKRNRQRAARRSMLERRRRKQTHNVFFRLGGGN